MSSSDTTLPPPAGHASVLMVDIVSSTALYEQVGDLRARETVGACLDTLSEVVGDHGGRVVKSLGDGLLCTFASAENAVNAALAMRDRSVRHKLNIRVGVHAGEVLDDDGDVFGDTVNTASRVSTLANPGEILITSDVHEGLSAEKLELVHPVAPVLVKGKREPLDLYTILENTSTGTIVAFAPFGPGGNSIALEVTYGEQTWKVGPERPEFSIGREAGNDLVVRDQFASRHHARIYYRGGKLMLADQSANGTYLVPSGGRKVVLRREEALLHGSGRVYFGADPDSSPTEPVLYRLEI